MPPSKNEHASARIDLQPSAWQNRNRCALEQHFNAGGMMHEGKVSTEMGLTGIPHEAETLRVTRDLDVLKYAGDRICLPSLARVST